MAKVNLDIATALLYTIHVMLYFVVAVDPDYIDKAKKIFGLGKKSSDLVDPYCCISYGGHKVGMMSRSAEYSRVTFGHLRKCIYVKCCFVLLV